MKLSAYELSHIRFAYRTVVSFLLVGALAAGLMIAPQVSASLPSHFLYASVVVMLVGAAGVLIYLRSHVEWRLFQAQNEDAMRLKRLRSDTLTGALSRHYFLEELAAAMLMTRRGSSFAIILIDLDFFKHLNDTHGHAAGDQALIHLVRIASRQPGWLVGRLGGDEFAVLCAAVSEGDAQEQADRFLSELRATPIEAMRSRTICQASIGIAMAAAHATQPQELIALADIALYESKRAGRGRATIYDPNMLAEARYQRFIQRELKAAVLLNELELHYQPIQSSNGVFSSCEALVRWRHPLRGLISPADFIPIAEQSTLIDTLGEWVFRRACRDYPKLGCRRVSINVSREQLRRDNILEMVVNSLEEHGRSPSEFVLEITETVATDASRETLGRIERLRQMGFQIALDDFGTGYCSFMSLRELPVDIIKVDRSYIRDLATDDVARILVSSLGELSRALGISLVAEGVETEIERDLAKAAGCSQLQGYLIARPMPLEHAMDFVHQRQPKERVLKLVS